VTSLVPTSSSFASFASFAVHSSFPEFRDEPFEKGDVGKVLRPESVPLQFTRRRVEL
jgi:hypothetical protein